MAEEYQQPQLHRHHEAEEEGAKRECLDDSESATAFATVDDYVTNKKTGEDELVKESMVPVFDTTDDVVGNESAVETKGRGLFGNLVGKEKAEEEEGAKRECLDDSKSATAFATVDDYVTNEKTGEDELVKESMVPVFDTTDDVVGNESAVETKGRGLLGNLIRKEKAEEEEMNEVATEFEKVSVVEEPAEKNEGKKLERSSSSSSLSDKEEGEGGEKKKKKGLTEKIKEMVSGGDEKEEEKPENTITVKEIEAASVEPTEVAYADAVADPAEEETGSVDEIKEKVPHPDQTNDNTEDAPIKVEEASTQEPETKEKKGILEKIKEKLPGYHAKAADT